MESPGYSRSAQSAAMRYGRTRDDGSSLLEERAGGVRRDGISRDPYWARGGSVKVSGGVLPVFSSPSSFLSLNRVWRSGDTVELSLPMDLHIDPMPDDQTIQGVMYGPPGVGGTFRTGE